MPEHTNKQPPLVKPHLKHHVETSEDESKMVMGARGGDISYPVKAGLSQGLEAATVNSSKISFGTISGIANTNTVWDGKSGISSSVIVSSTNTPNYIYDEDKFLTDLKKHVDSTYGAHYAQGGIQTVEYIMANATTLDYLIGNAIKYLQRYGKKEGFNQIDLLKAVHYIMMMAKYSEQIKNKG